MIVTATQLLAIMPSARKRYSEYLKYINKYAKEFNINTPLRMAHYLAQIAHESCELKYTVEQGGRAYFDKYDTGKLAARLGNTPQKDGDGYTFRGRGLIQITGRTNYEAYKKYCKFDVVGNPQLLEMPLGAVRSSMWFFAIYANLLKFADADDVLTITKRINGGTNGLESRKAYLAKAKKALGVKK